MSPPLMHRLKLATRVLQHEGLRQAISYILKGDHFINRKGRPDETALAFAALKDLDLPQTMIDVGAHTGSSLRPFLRAGWNVYAFEPDPNNRKILSERFGRYTELHIDSRAVSAAPAEGAAFYTSDQSTGISGLSAFHESHVMSARVEVTTLQDLTESLPNIRNGVAFLKVDTEGFDLMVLRGVPWDLLAPKVIVCEFEDAKTEELGYRFEDITDFVREKGFEIIVSEWYPIKRYGGPHDWRRFSLYPCELADNRAWGNLIATRDPDIMQCLKTMCRL